MNTKRIQRTAAVLAVSITLLAGGATSPAAAASSDESAYLTQLKQAWTDSPRANRVTVCMGYKKDPAQVVALSVADIWRKPAVRASMTRAAWTRTITKYLAWACSGPGTTPRR